MKPSSKKWLGFVVNPQPDMAGIHGLWSIILATRVPWDALCGLLAQNEEEIRSFLVLTKHRQMMNHEILSSLFRTPDIETYCECYGGLWMLGWPFHDQSTNTKAMLGAHATHGKELISWARWLWHAMAIDGYYPVWYYWLVVGPSLWKIWKSIGMIIPKISSKF